MTFIYNPDIFENDYIAEQEGILEPNLPINAMVKRIIANDYHGIRILYQSINDKEDYFTNVTANNLNSCIVTEGYNHKSNGKLFIIIGIRRNYFIDNVLPPVQEFPYRNSVYFPISLGVMYNIFTIHNTTFADLKINVNNSSHDFVFESIKFAMVTARNLILTGGLNGYSVRKLEELFDSYIVEVKNSTTTYKQNEEGRRKGRFYGFQINDLPMISLIESFDSSEELNPELAKVIDKITSEIKDRIESFDNNYNDGYEDFEKGEVDESDEFTNTMRRTYGIYLKFKPSKVNDVTLDGKQVSIHTHKTSIIPITGMTNNIHIPEINVNGDYSKIKPAKANKARERGRKQIENFNNERYFLKIF